MMKHRQRLKLLSLLLILKAETAFAEVNLQEGSFNFVRQERIETSKNDILNFERSYSSRSDHAGLLGLGWCTEFEWSLVRSGTEAWIQKCDDIEMLSPDKIADGPLLEVHVKNTVAHFDIY